MSSVDAQLESFRRYLTVTVTEVNRRMQQLRDDRSTISDGMRDEIQQMVSAAVRQLQSSISAEIASKVEREKRILETMMSVKMTDIANKVIDSALTYRLNRPTPPPPVNMPSLVDIQPLTSMPSALLADLPVPIPVPVSMPPVTDVDIVPVFPEDDTQVEGV